MNKWILLLCCLIAYVSAETYSFNVYFNGTTCEICGVNNFEYTVNGASATAYFQDPLPQNSVVTSFSVTTTAMYWCGSYNIYPNINGYGNFTISNGYYCTCGVCPPVMTESSRTYSNGLPGYNYGGSNALNVVNAYSSSGGSVGIAVLTVVLTYQGGHSGGNNATVSIPYFGCGFCSLCDSETYALSNGGTDCGEGGWDDGFRYFQDPAPTGVTITQITVMTSAVWWCEAPAQANFTVNGIVIGNTQPQEHQECMCDTCPQAQAIASKVYSMGFPSYNYQALNSFQINVNSGVMAVGSVSVVVTFTQNGNAYESIVQSNE